NRALHGQLGGGLELPGGRRLAQYLCARCTEAACREAADCALCRAFRADHVMGRQYRPEASAGPVTPITPAASRADRDFENGSEDRLAPLQRTGADGVPCAWRDRAAG